jgi:hypothetical protein
VNTAALVIVLIVNIPLFFVIGRYLFFHDWDEFGEAIFFWFKPDLWSMMDGTFWEDWMAEMKLGLLGALVIGMGFAEYHFLAGLFG